MRIALLLLLLAAPLMGAPMPRRDGPEPVNGTYEIIWGCGSFEFYGIRG